MKIAISESQYKRLFEQEEYVLQIPSLEYFNNDWDLLQKYLKSKGNPLYSIGGSLNLFGTSIESLGNLTSVGGSLDLEGTPIKSLGNLTSIGGYLDLTKTPLSKMYDSDEISKMVKVDGDIYL